MEKLVINTVGDYYRKFIFGIPSSTYVVGVLTFPTSTRKLVQKNPQPVEKSPQYNKGYQIMNVIMFYNYIDI